MGKISDKAKGAVKDAAKSKAKEIAKGVIKKLLPYILVGIGIFLGIVLLAGIFLVLISGIGDIVTGIVESMGEFFSGLGNWFESLFDPDRGKFIIKINETKFDEIKSTLASQGINAEESSLTDECLKLFILAQYKTQYPEDVVIMMEVTADEKARIEQRNRGRTSKINVDVVNEDGVDKYYIKTSGCIKLYRPEFSDRALRYTNQQELDEYKAGTKGFNDVKGKYTIDTNGNLIVPTKYVEEFYKGVDQVQGSGQLLNLNEEEDNAVWENFRKDINTTREIQEIPKLSDPIPYQSMISSYTMPFEFLTILTTFTQNSEYGVSVAQLIISNETSIELNILDNSITNEERHIEQYISKTNAKFKVGAKAYLPIYSTLWNQYAGNIREYYVEDREWIWDSDRETYSIENEYTYLKETPRIYRENYITTEYKETLQTGRVVTWFVTQENSYNEEKTESTIDKTSIGSNPQITTPPYKQPFQFNIDNQEGYQGLQNLYDTKEKIQKFINDYYNKDTGKNGINDFREDLFKIYQEQSNSIVQGSNYKDKLLNYINKFVEYKLFYKFYANEISMNFNVVPLDFMDKIDELSEKDKRIKNKYDVLRRARDDYFEESTNHKIETYDVMPFEIMNTKTNHQVKKSYYVSEKKYIDITGKTEDNTQNFLELLIKNNEYVEYKSTAGTKKPGADLASAPDMLFEILANNPKTANLENAMRYIMYKMTNKDYGVTDFNSAYRNMNAKRVGADYSVTDSSIFINDKNKLIKAIKSLGLPAQAQQNLIDNADAFLDMQSTYNINAALAISVAIAESTAGTNWAAIDSSTYNWMSISGDYNGQSLGGWRKYSSFREATLDFGNLISGDIYCRSGNTTISKIGNIYCPNTDEYPTQADTWISNTQASMTKILKAGDVDLSSYSGGSILECAETIHEYMEQNDYFYSLDGGLLKTTFEESKATRATCCATYVSWVLIEAGYLDPSEMSHRAIMLASILKQKGFTEVSSSDLQPGDIMCYNYGHIEIYAGDGTIYNAGSDTSIKSAAPSTQWNVPDYGLRAP